MRCIVLLSAMAMASSCLGGETSFQSGPGRTHLIELFTSEGCSSCPPAEAWLSKLQSDPRLWTEFVPIAFHVTYWDNRAWRDPFASKQWTDRQYAYTAAWKSSSVYTPGFVLDGREWLNREIPPAGSAQPGVLKVTLTSDTATVTFSPAAQKGAHAYEAHLAQLGFALQSDVKGGENGGRKLAHDFVVLSLDSTRLGETPTAITLGKTSSGPPRALALWVTEAGSLESIQATGGWLK